MEDLHGNDDRGGITLDMKNRQRYFEGRASSSETAVKVDYKTALAGIQGQLVGWESSLNKASHAMRLDSMYSVYF
jgi:transcription initiation factor TFIIH subunit 1